MFKLKQYIKITGAFGLALIIVTLLNNIIFVQNSPALRSNLAENVMFQMNSTKASISRLLAFILNPQLRQAQQLAETQGEKAMKALDTVPFQQIAKGTYAKSNETASVTLIKLGEIEWVEYTFNINGRTIKIRVPKDANVTQDQLKAQLSRE